MTSISSRTLVRALTRPTQCDSRLLRARSSLAVAAVALARGGDPLRDDPEGGGPATAAVPRRAHVPDRSDR